MTHIEDAQKFLKRYEAAVKAQDKKTIMELDMEHAESNIHLDRIPDHLGDRLNELVSEANEILY